MSNLKTIGRSSQNAAGLTLVELLVVLGILGLMTAVAIPSLARMGLFAGDDVGKGSRELFALMRAAKVYAATSTYRVDTAIAYGVVLKQDSVTNQAVESINAAAMVERLPDAVRDRCLKSVDPEVNPLTGEIEKIPVDTDVEVFMPVKDALGGTMFKEFPRDTGLNAEFLLYKGVAPDETKPEARASAGLRKSVRPILIYEVSNDDNDATYEVRLIKPLKADTALLASPSLPVRFSYLPANEGYLGYQPNADCVIPPSTITWMSFAFPAHVFTPSGRMKFADPYLVECPVPVIERPVIERIHLAFGFSPDAAPAERYLDPSNLLLGERNNVAIELYRATGRVNLAPEEEFEYYCGTHPLVVRNRPGKCPTCGIDLIERKKG